MQIFRRYLQSKVSKILAIVIIMIFLSWDFIMTKQNQDNYLFSVGKIDYSMKDWQDNYRKMINDPISAEEALHNPIATKKRIFDDLVKRALLIQEAERLGFTVSEKMVASEIVNLKAFKDEEGNFSPELLTDTLKQNNITESNFVNNMKENLMRNHLMDLFYNSSGILAQPLYQMIESLVAAEQEIFLYKIPQETVDVTPSEEELIHYRDANPDLFSLPEKAYYLEAKFDSSNLDPKSLEVTEEELQSAYEQDKEFEPEARIFNQIVITSYKEALALSKDIQEGKKTYDEVAKFYQEKALVPYEMGPITAKNLDPDFAKEIFTLKEGDLAKILESPIGWHLIRVVKIIPQKAKDFKEVKNQLLTKLQEDKIAKELQKLAQKILLEDKVLLEEIANKYQLKITNKVKERLLEQAEEDNISNKKLLTSLFQGEESGIKLIPAKDNKSFILIEITKKEPKRLEPLTLEKVQNYYLESKKDQATKDKANEIRKALLEGKELAIKPEKTILSRIKPNDLIPASLEMKIFELEEQGIFTGVIGPEKLENNYFIAQLGKLSFPAKLEEDQKAEIKRLVESLYQESLFKNYLESLKTQYPVKVNPTFSDYLNQAEK